MKVVLVEPEYPENLGMVARLCKNFGAELVLVNPRVEIDDTVRQRAMHAQDVLDSVKIVNSLDEVDSPYLVGTTAKLASDYNVNRAYEFPWELERVENMALVFGRESTGLTNEELALCDTVVYIPTRPEYRTLNIANAVAILLYELYRREDERTVADRKVREQIYTFWDGLLDRLDYPRDKRRIQLLLFRRVLERARLTAREAYGIAGVLKKLQELF